MIKENIPASMSLTSYKKRYFSNKKSIKWESDKLVPMIITPVKLNGVRVDAMWDTGSEISIISSPLSERLNLEVVATSLIRNFESEVNSRMPNFCADLNLHKDVVIRNLRLVGGYKKLSDYFDIILGLDVINEGKCIIDCSKGVTTFEFVV